MNLKNGAKKVKLHYITSLKRFGSVGRVSATIIDSRDLATASVCITKFILADVVTHFLEERYRTVIFAKLGEAFITFKTTVSRSYLV